MTFEAQTANKAALLQVGKLLEAFPELGMKKGRVYICFEEGKATSVGVDNAFGGIDTCAKKKKEI
jgi:hypothetical protein